MELVIWFVLLVGPLVLAIVCNLVACDLYDRAPLMAKRLIDKAVSRLPDNTRERYREEWYAHLHEISGNMSKLSHALRCYFFAASGVAAAFATSKERSARIRLAQNLRRFKELLDAKPFDIVIDILFIICFFYIFFLKVQIAVGIVAQHVYLWTSLLQATILPCVLMMLFGTMYLTSRNALTQ